MLSVMQAHLGYRSETRWLRRAHKDFHSMFPYLPGQSGYNKRLKKLAKDDRLADRATRRGDPGGR